MSRFVSAVLSVLAGAMACGCNSGPRVETRADSEMVATFDASGLFAVSDLDMAGTAYADGLLHPMRGATDRFTSILDSGSATAGVDVSNSVAGWPGSIDLSPDNNFAYVVETRGPAPRGVGRLDNVYTGLSAGRFLTSIDVSDPRAPTIVGTVDVGTNPMSVHAAPNGRWLAIATDDVETPLSFVLLDHGAPVAVRRINVQIANPTRRPTDPGLTFARINPAGDILALHVANTHVQFARVIFDADGAPADVALVGAAVHVGEWLSMGRWSPDGRHYVVSDTGWGPEPLDAAFNAPGQLVSVAVSDEGGRIAARARVSLSPEGFDMDRGGALLIVVNMERTYLPDNLPYSIFGRRQRASLSLVSFEPASGALRMVDGPVGFRGVLPEDAVFDSDGDMIAVAVFHDQITTPIAGWVEYFGVDRSGAAPRIVPTGRRTPMPRGTHDLAVAYSPPAPIGMSGRP